MYDMYAVFPDPRGLLRLVYDKHSLVLLEVFIFFEVHSFLFFKDCCDIAVFSSPSRSGPFV